MSASEIGYSKLKDRQRADREEFPEQFDLRIHRMISWIGRAERETDDPAAAFIFLWIAFNAGYSDGKYMEGQIAESERKRFERFFKKIVDGDTDDLIGKAVWNRFSGPIRRLLDSEYVFAPFWAFHHGYGEPDWKARFEKSRKQFKAAFQRGDTAVILSFLFERLYLLRNQLIHGGATWDSSVNRDQLLSGSEILSCIIPLMVQIMMNHPKENWGRPFFPVIDDLQRMDAMEGGRASAVGTRGS